MTNVFMIKTNCNRTRQGINLKTTFSINKGLYHYWKVWPTTDWKALDAWFVHQSRFYFKVLTEEVRLYNRNKSKWKWTLSKTVDSPRTYSDRQQHTIWSNISDKIDIVFWFNFEITFVIEH